MRGAYHNQDVLLPLWGRGCLDLRLYLLLAALATSTGRVGTVASPIGMRRLADLLALPGGHGKAPESPSFQSLARALVRLEGVPGRTDYPRYLRVVQTIRGRGSIFQLEMGRGEIRQFAPAGRPAGHSRRPALRANGRSADMSTAQPDAQPDTSNNTFFLSKERVREATPVDKSTGREHLAKLRKIFAGGTSS